MKNLSKINRALAAKKKFFTFFAVMLFTLTVNATSVILGTEGSPKATHANAISAVVGSYDTIYLRAGIYTESDRLTFSGKTHVIKAISDSAVIKSTKNHKLLSGAKVTFDGIFFDGSSMNSSYKGITTEDNTTGKELHLNNCEFYDFPNIIIACDNNGYLIDSVVINNCYFHDGTTTAIFFEKSSIDGHVSSCDTLKIKNSTFAYFALASDAALISFNTTGSSSSTTDKAKMLVDHCTFYSYSKTGSGTYGIVDSRYSTNIVVSNCIFANPSSIAVANRAKATQLYGGSILKCLRWNVPEHRNTPSAGNDINEDPLFVDAANGDFRLKADYTSGGEVSPAIGAATDGSNLGDPNRGVKYTYYTTDFAGGYAFTAAVAAISSSSLESNEHYGVDNPYLRYTGSTSTDAIASWVIQATRACYVNVTVDLVDNSWNYSTDNTYQNGKHIFGVEIWNSNNVRVDTVGEGTYEHGSSLDGYNDTYPTVGLGQLYIPAAGVYTVKLLNKRSWSKCGVGSVTFTYCEPIDVYLKVGLWDDAGATEGYAVYDNTNKCWSKFMTVEDADMKLYTTKILADATTVQFHRVDGSATHPRDGKWNSSGDQSKASNRDLWTVTDWNNSGNWNKYLPSLTQDSYYLCGTMNNWIPNADGLFTLNKEGEYKLNTTLAEGDEFKAVLVNNKIIDSYYPGGSDPNYVVGSSKAGSVTIYLRPAGGGDGTWHCGTLYVEKTATSLDNINASNQAVKRLENGQLVIIRGENAYTVTGVRIR